MRKASCSATVEKCTTPGRQSPSGNIQQALSGRLRPADLVEERPQALAPRRIDRRHPSDATLEVLAEMRVSAAVLAVGAEAGGVEQQGAQVVELVARQIGAVVDHQAAQVLPAALAHHPRL